ncbi:PAS domain-containing sensor histidine kinase, partial [Klebsiella pneumoniae]
IIGFTETLLDGALEDRATSRSFLEIIQEESRRLHRLIGDILDLSNIESRELSLNIETVDISHLVRTTAETLMSQVDEKDLSLHLHLPAELKADGDKDRLRQIVVNLLSNAIAYTPRGGSIDVTVAAEGERWRLEVEDTGIGIPEDDLPRIFERFYRVDRARSRESGGTGLGLAIVKHLVD